MVSEHKTKFGGSSTSMALLQVVVAGGCFGCGEAKRLFHEVRSRLPGFPIEMVDVDKTPERKPEAVFAVPSYVIEGSLAFTGNPTLEQLLSRLGALNAHAQDPASEQHQA